MKCPKHMKYCAHKFNFILLILFFASSNNLWAQLPNCTMLYLDQYSVSAPISSTLEIYNFNPTAPIGANNPSLNTIQLPDIGALGLTVSEVLGSNDPTLTFYTVIADEYWYYSPTTFTWLNTGHLTGSFGNAYNIASGGGFIYNLDGNTGDVYKYSGNGDGSYLITIPGFVEEGPYDLIADCAGNFYVLNVTGINSVPFMRKYSSSGALVQSWAINNPNNYFVGNGYGLTAGFGIIGTQIYVDNYDNTTQTETIVTGVINSNVVNFTNSSSSIPAYANNGTLMGDFGSCAGGVPVLPLINITASATTVTAGTSVTFSSSINAGGSNPEYQWFVNGIAVNGAINATFSYIPLNNDIVTCQLTSNLACVSTPTGLSNAINIKVECPQPMLNFNPSTFCKGAGFVMPTYSPNGGMFEASPSGISIDNNTGAINLNSSEIGTYTVIYTLPQNPSCPAISVNDTVSISISPTVHITVDAYDAKLCLNQLITLHVDSLKSYTYKWSPENYFPGKDDEATVVAKTVAPGFITVNVSDGTSCGGSDSIELKPEACCNVMIPNAFSPNSDGLNDVFSINSNAIQDIKQFSIYNRFGERIFYTNIQSNGWDGTYRNKPADPGVYFYYLYYTCANGQEIVRKGDINLIR